MEHRRPTRRGLSLLELILATSITAMIGAAIAGMLTAVSSGVGASRDGRAAMVRTNAANVRLSSYIAPSNCILAAYADSGIVLWLADTRQSDTVHATEVRWLLYDQSSDSMMVYFVAFPDDWSQTARDLADTELPASSNWMTVLETFNAAGHIAAIPLVDALDDVSVTIDAVDAMEARCVYFDLTMASGSGATQTRVSSTIRFHEGPTL